MRGLRLFRRERSIEKVLRAERPEPSRRLVRAITAELAPARSRRLPARRPARVLALSAALTIGLLAVGGLGYAMTAATNFVVKVTSSHVVVKHGTVRTVVLNAANDQYGTTTTTTTTSGGGGGTTTTTTTTSTTTTSGGGETSAIAEPGTSGSVETTQPGTQNAVKVQWAPTTFSSAVTVNVDPTPPLTGTTFLGASNQVVSISVVTASGGTAVHTLATPLDVLFPNPTPGFVPAISTDGVNFRALTEISGPPLPDNMQDAYYVDSTGLHILTRHLTLFAVLYKANVNVSESGRKTAAPGSGKFGDPTRMHVGAPTLKFVGTPSASGRTVSFTFYVDEQAAVYMSALSGGSAKTIVANGSVYRGHAIGGVNRKTVHVVVLRPGTIKVTMRVKGSPEQIRVTAVDYDGHAVTQTAKVS